MPIVTVPPPAAPAAAARQATARATVRTEKVRRTVSSLLELTPLRPTRLPAGFPGRKAELGPDCHKERARARRYVRARLLRPARTRGIVQEPPRGRVPCGAPTVVHGGWNGEQVEDQGERSRSFGDREPGHAAPLRPAQRAPPAWPALR